MGRAERVLRTTDLLGLALDPEVQDDAVAEALDAILEAATSEDAWFEVKGGDWFTKDKKTRSQDRAEPESVRGRVQKYIAAFANSNGGVLVLGVDEPRDEDGQRHVDPATGSPRGPWRVQPDEGKDLQQITKQKVSQYLHGLAPHLGPGHTWRQVAIDGQTVVLIAVARAPTLVPVIENQRRKHYYRFGDAVLPLPPYLEEDLFLGTRRHPHFRIPGNLSWSASRTELHVTVEVMNESLVWAPDVFTGLVAYSCKRKPVSSQEIQRRLAVEPCDDEGLHPCLFSETKGDGVAPFQRATVAYQRIPLRGTLGRLRGALFVVAQGHRPQWWRWSVEIGPGSKIRSHEVAEVVDDSLIQVAVGSSEPS